MSITPNIADRIKEITTTTGTGSIILAGAEFTFKTFSSSFANGSYVPYAIIHETANEWEVGYGQYNTASLSRVQIYSGVNGNNFVNFSSGSKNVICTYPAGKAIIYNLGDSTLNLSGSVIISPTSSLPYGASNELFQINSILIDPVRWSRSGDDGSGVSIISIKSRGSTIGAKSKVQVGDALWINSIFGVAGDNSTVAFSSFWAVDASNIPVSGTSIASDHVWGTTNIAGSTAIRTRLNSEGQFFVGNATQINNEFVLDNPTQMIISTLMSGSSLSIQDFKANSTGSGISFLKSKSGVIGTKTAIGTGTDIMALNLWGIADDSATISNAGAFSFNTTFTTSSYICGEYRWWARNQANVLVKQMALSSEGVLTVSGAINNLGPTSSSLGLAVKTSGSTSRIGRATLSNGTVKVSNTSIQVQTDVFITNIKLIGSGTVPSVSRSFGDGFTISGSTADNSTYSWMLVDEY